MEESCYECLFFLWEDFRVFAILREGSDLICRGLVFVIGKEVWGFLDNLFFSFLGKMKSEVVC